MAVFVFIFWEAAVTLAAVRAAWWCGWGRESAPEENLLALTGCNVVIASLIASGLSFARINSAPAYWVAGGALCTLGYGARPALQAFAASLRELAIFRYPITLALLAALWVPLFLFALRPAGEVDSMHYLHYLLEYMANRLTPYTFHINVVAFWELGFLPVWTLTRLDLFFPLIALKALVALASALFLLGRELDIGDRLLIWTTAAGMAFLHFWGGYSGVGTLKNDALHAAGSVMLALALVRAARNQWGSTGFPLLALAVTLASVKYLGAMLAAVCVAAILFQLRRGWLALAGIAALWVITSGHYYLRRLILYGNPFYPFQINFGFVHLPGAADLSGTSIMASLRDPRLWRALLLPPGGMSVAGLLFPAMFVAAFAAIAWILIRGLRRPGPLWWLSAFLLLGWMLYFRSFYSASSVPGDLAYVLNDLNSLRYTEGVLAMSELLLVALLLRSPVPVWAPYAVVGITLASRLGLIYSRLPRDWYGAALAGAVLFPLPFLLRPARAWLGAGCAAAALIAATPWVVERNRETAAPWWKEIYTAVRALPPSSVFLYDEARDGGPAAHYLLAGRKLEHDVRTGTTGADRYRYVARLLGPDAREPEATLDAFAARLAPPGYITAIRSRHGMLLEKARREPWPAGEVSALYVPPDEMAPRAYAGAAFTPQRSQVLRPGARETRVLVPREGSRLLATNCGPLDAAGRFTGLAYEYRCARWLPDLSRAEVLSEGVSEHPEVSMAEGNYRLERHQEAGGEFTRLTALDPSRWLILIVRPPRALAPAAPVTIRAEVRCPRPCKVWFVGSEGAVEWPAGAGGGWVWFAESRRLRAGSPRDYFAIGLEKPVPGEGFDVRRFTLLAGLYP